MRDARTYRGARKRNAKALGVPWTAVDYRRHTVKPASETQTGVAFALKAAGNGRVMRRHSKNATKFVYADIPEDGQ